MDKNVWRRTDSERFIYWPIRIEDWNRHWKIRKQILLSKIYHSGEYFWSVLQRNYSQVFNPLEFFNLKNFVKFRSILEHLIGLWLKSFWKTHFIEMKMFRVVQRNILRKWMKLTVASSFFRVKVASFLGSLLPRLL